jgi:uncharacterized repeat protein (TIGR02543 family)
MVASYMESNPNVDPVVMRDREVFTATNISCNWDRAHALHARWRFGGTESMNYQRIREDISLLWQPIVIQLSGPPGTHFVVAHRFTGSGAQPSEILVRDPWFDKLDQTLADSMGTWPNIVNIRRANHNNPNWNPDTGGATRQVAVTYTEGGVTRTTSFNINMLPPKATGQVAVTLNGNGGIPDTAAQIRTAGAPFGELPSPIRDGYTFDGWHLDEHGSGPRITPTTLVPPQDTTCYAAWANEPDDALTIFPWAQGNFFEPGDIQHHGASIDFDMSMVTIEINPPFPTHNEHVGGFVRLARDIDFSQYETIEYSYRLSGYSELSSGQQGPVPDVGGVIYLGEISRVFDLPRGTHIIPLSANFEGGIDIWVDVQRPANMTNVLYYSGQLIIDYLRLRKKKMITIFPADLPGKESTIPTRHGLISTSKA